MSRAHISVTGIYSEYRVMSSNVSCFKKPPNVYCDNCIKAFVIMLEIAAIALIIIGMSKWGFRGYKGVIKVVFCLSIVGDILSRMGRVFDNISPLPIRAVEREIAKYNHPEFFESENGFQQFKEKMNKYIQ